jgi:predicted esterase
MRPSRIRVSPLVAAPALAALLFAGRVCGQESELKDESGNTIARYVLETPEGLAPAGAADPAKQVGLILCFQEHGHPTGDDIFPVRESLRRLGLSDHFVLLAAHSQDPKGKMAAADREPIKKLIAWAEKTYPINPRRIYAFGKGEGGKISDEMGALYPELITAGISYSWGFWAMASEVNAPLDPEKTAEFYMVLGRRDLAHHLTTVRDAYERVEAKGYHVIYREFDELGERSYHPASNDDAIAWATRLRNKIQPLSEGEKKLLEPFNRSAAPRSSGGYYPALALVGGSQAGSAVRKLFASRDAEVRLAAADTCSHAIFDEATTGALSQLLNDHSVKVRRAAVNALAMYANWRSEAAQQALIRLAADTNARLEDRVNAADGIAQAVALQAKGVRQDPPLFRALVSLLKDPNEPLHAVAYLALAPVRDPGYQPGVAPENKTPPGGWQQWLDEITLKQQGDLADYKVCASASGASGSSAPQAGEDLFCRGGARLTGVDPASGAKTQHDVAAAFHDTLAAAEQGYVPAEEAVAMMYADGKGVEQNYAEAGKWWVKAAEGGNLRAANHAALLYRNGEGVPRNRDIADKWTRYVADHPGLPSR